MSVPAETRIRRAMTNCSKGEASRMTLPAWVRDLDPDHLDDVHGWRDPKAPERAVLLVPTDHGPAGIMLRTATGTARTAAMCALCRTTHSVGGVALFAAPRQGAAGRHGDTVGTYICADLGCARHVRVEHPTAALRPAPGTTTDERRIGLRERAVEFVGAVTGSRA